MTAVEFLGGPRQGETLPLDGKSTILGRGKECDIPIDDPEISRKHCKIVREGAEWRIVDLGSSNGIWIRGDRVDRAFLLPDDVVVIGKSKFRLVRREASGVRDATDAYREGGEPVPARRGRFALTLYHRFLLYIALAIAASGAVLTWPLFYTQREIAGQDALRSAASLVQALAASNQEALRLNDEMLLDTARVTKNENVLQAFIYDRNGRILFPVDQLHGKPEDPAGRQAIAADSLRIDMQSRDHYDLAEPIRYFNVQTGRMEKIGTARILYSSRTTRRFLQAAGYRMLGSVLISSLLALACAFLLSRLVRSSLRGLRDDVESALKDGRNAISSPDSAVADGDLVATINRCLTRIGRVQDQRSAGPDAASPPSGGRAVDRGESARTEALCGIVGDALLVMDGNNRVVLANDSYCKGFHLSAEDIRGAHLIDAVNDPVLLSCVMESIRHPDVGSPLARTLTLADGRSVSLKIGTCGDAQKGDRSILVALRGLSAPEEHIGREQDR